MGICVSSSSSGSDGADAPETKRSRVLDRQIKEDEKRMMKEVKLLLLGAGESGKSTILKSMRIIHQVPFTPAEREHFRRLVFVNLVGGMRSCLDAMEEWAGQFEHPEYVVSVRRSRSWSTFGVVTLTPFAS